MVKKSYSYYLKYLFINLAIQFFFFQEIILHDSLYTTASLLIKKKIYSGSSLTF